MGNCPVRSVRNKRHAHCVESCLLMVFRLPNRLAAQFGHWTCCIPHSDPLRDLNRCSPSTSWSADAEKNGDKSLLLMHSLDLRCAMRSRQPCTIVSLIAMQKRKQEKIIIKKRSIVEDVADQDAISNHKTTTLWHRKVISALVSKSFYPRVRASYGSCNLTKEVESFARFQ